MEKYLNKEFILSNKEKIIKVAVIIILIAVAFFVFVFGDDEEDQLLIDSEQQTLAALESQPSEETVGKIIVDVAGAVNNPKVVELDADSRVADAIAAAGGLTDDADTSKINQAAFVTDGEKIYIPEYGEESNGDSGDYSWSDDSSKIDINTATSEELQTLSGVGPATAEKIISYRSDVGYFKSIEELKNVDGIGDKTFEKLKDYITV